MTVWKRVNGYPFYEVSDDGRVRTTGEPRLRGRCVQRRPQFELRLSKDRLGYLYVELANCDGPKKFKVHRLVAEAFIPNPSGKPQVNHIDGDKANNNAQNIEWATSQENIRHSISSLKRFQMGAVHHKARLSDDAVRAIRESNKTLKELSEFYGTSISTIASARRGETWKHVE